KRQASSKRENDRAGQPAGSAEIANRQRQLRETGARTFPRQPRYRERKGIEDQQHHSERAAEISCEHWSIRAYDSYGCKYECQTKGGNNDVAARPSRRRAHLITEQDSRRNLLRPTQWPDRKQQRHKQPVANRRDEA